MRKIMALTSAAILLAGCATYKVPTSRYGPEENSPYFDVKKKANESQIYNYVPLRREQIRFYDIGHWVCWATFGNENDGIFGERQDATPYSTNICFKTFVSWSVLRNPMNNFDFYVIGSADWKKHNSLSLFSIGGEKPARLLSTSVKWIKKDDPVFDLGFNDYKPYIKIRPHTKKHALDLFFGWRKNGAFGVRTRFESKEN